MYSECHCILEHLSSLSPGRQNEKQKKMIMYFYLHTPVKNRRVVLVYFLRIRFRQSTQKNVGRFISAPILLSPCLAHQPVLTSY